MAEVNGDPEAIRAFAARLAEFHQQTHEQLGALASHLGELGWSDRKFQEYSQVFESSRAVLSHALEEIETEQVPHLRRLADILEEFLSERA
jgi:uncharacterized protein YukE